MLNLGIYRDYCSKRLFQVLPDQSSYLCSGETCTRRLGFQGEKRRKVNLPNWGGIIRHDEDWCYDIELWT